MSKPNIHSVATFLASNVFHAMPCTFCTGLHDQPRGGCGTLIKAPVGTFLARPIVGCIHLARSPTRNDKGYHQPTHSLRGRRHLFSSSDEPKVSTRGVTLSLFSFKPQGEQNVSIAVSRFSRHPQGVLLQQPPAQTHPLCDLTQRARHHLTLLLRARGPTKVGRLRQINRRNHQYRLRKQGT